MSDAAYVIAAALILGYVLGSFPTAYILGRLLRGIDVREVGSRNMGAMNVGYSFGLKYGILVLALDMAKGVLAVASARWLGASMTLQVLAGTCAIVGHMLPVFLAFRGGKGGATYLGIFAFLLPWAIPYYWAVLIVAGLLTRYLTLSYAIAMLSIPVVGWLVYDSILFVASSLGLMILPLLRYIPRLMEMRSKAGGWRRVFIRTSLKERY